MLPTSKTSNFSRTEEDLDEEITQKVFYGKLIQFLGINKPKSQIKRHD